MTLGDMINLARGQETSQVFERSRLPLRHIISAIIFPLAAPEIIRN